MLSIANPVVPLMLTSAHDSHSPFRRPNPNPNQLDVHDFYHRESPEAVPIDYRTIRKETYKDPELISNMNHIRSGTLKDCTLNLKR